MLFPEPPKPLNGAHLTKLSLLESLPIPMTTSLVSISIKLFLLLMHREYVKEIIKQNTYKPEVIPTLITKFFLTIFLEMSKNLPHDLEKKSTILSDTELLNLLPSLIKILTSINNRGLKKAFRYNPLSLSRFLSHFGAFTPFEDLADFFLNIYQMNQQNQKIIRFQKDLKHQY